MKRVGLILGMCVAVQTVPGMAVSQDASTQTLPDSATVDELEAPAVTAAPPREDPFTLEGLGGPTAQIAPGLNFRSAETRPASMPELTLRGIGRMNGNDTPTALIEVAGHGLFIVGEEDTISLQSLPGDNVLRIVEINDISVTVETGSFGELIVVR